MLTLALEPIDAVRAAGIDDLLVGHWEEVEDEQQRVPLAINWPAYYALERCGVLKTLALRRDGRLIGYSVWLVQPTLHHNTTTWAICDVLYVDPKERGYAGVALIRRGEKILRGLGARVITYNVKPDTGLAVKRGRVSVGPLLHRLGYRLAEECWARYF